MSDEKLKYVIFEEILGPIDFLMSTVGIKKIYDESSSVRSNFRIVQWILCAVSASNLALLSAMSVVNAFLCENDCVLVFLDAMPNGFIGLISLTKLATLIVHQKLIFELIKNLKDLWPRSDDEKSKQRFSKIVDPTIKLCFIYLGVTACTAFAFGLSPIIDALLEYVKFGQTKLKMVFPIWYPFDHQKSWPVSIIVFITQLWVGYTAAVFMSTIDSFLCILISLLCYHFESIADCLKGIKPSFNENTKYTTIIEVANDDLIKCIKYHGRMLRLSQLLEDIFSLAMFVNFSVSAATLCQILFNIMVATPDRIPNYLLFIVSTVIQVYMISWHSDLLISQSSAILSAAFQCDWFKMDKKFKTNLIQLQMRAHKPSTLTAMKFATLSLPTFFSIMGSTWSYFTLLRTLYTK